MANAEAAAAPLMAQRAALEPGGSPPVRHHSWDWMVVEGVGEPLPSLLTAIRGSYDRPETTRPARQNNLPRSL
jgi:hypothetical protein